LFYLTNTPTQKSNQVTCSVVFILAMHIWITARTLWSDRTLRTSF